MHKLFEGHPKLMTAVKVGIVVFISLSLVNLYYSIQINRKLLAKQEAE